MSAARRIPNRIKFSMVMSDRSKIEGTLKCSDEQWSAIFAILLPEIVPAEQPIPTGNGDTDKGEQA